jgi:hypothetical protein
LEGCLHRLSPLNRTRAFAGISERLKDTGDTRKKTAIKIKHAKESLETFDIRGEKKIEDRLNAGRKRS